MEDKDCFLNTEIIGSRTGRWKGKKSGIKHIKRSLVQIPLFDLHVLEGRLKFYRMYEHMLSIRLNSRTDQLFLKVNKGRTKPEEFFKSQNLGKEFFDRSVNNVCCEAGLTG